MSLRDEVIDKIRKYITAFKQFNMDVDYQPREILEMVEQEGYMHKDDVAEGWVVNCPHYNPEAKWNCSYEGDCKREVMWPHPMCNGNPATIQEVLDGKAVKA